MKKCGRYGCANQIEGVDGPYVMQNLCEGCQEYAKKTLSLFDSGNLSYIEMMQYITPSKEKIDFEEGLNDPRIHRSDLQQL